MAKRVMGELKKKTEIKLKLRLFSYAKISASRYVRFYFLFQRKTENVHSWMLTQAFFWSLLSKTMRNILRLFLDLA